MGKFGPAHIVCERVSCIRGLQTTFGSWPHLMNLLETYLQDLYDIHSSGAAVKETSYYGMLHAALLALSKTMKSLNTHSVCGQTNGPPVPFVPGY